MTCESEPDGGGTGTQESALEPTVSISIDVRARRNVNWRGWPRAGATGRCKSRRAHKGRGSPSAPSGAFNVDLVCSKIPAKTGAPGISPRWE